MDTLGNKDILNRYKIGFFCSKNCPPHLIPRIYDWAISKRDEGAVVISGFHTPIEKEVLKFLLKGKQPIIVCPARSLHKFKIPVGLKSAYESNRILFISNFDDKIVRTTKKSSLDRNKIVVNLSDEVVIGFAERGGGIERLIKEINILNIQFVK